MADPQKRMGAVERDIAAGGDGQVYDLDFLSSLAPQSDAELHRIAAEGRARAIADGSVSQQRPSWGSGTADGDLSQQIAAMLSAPAAGAPAAPTPAPAEAEPIAESIASAFQRLFARTPPTTPAPSAVESPPSPAGGAGAPGSVSAVPEGAPPQERPIQAFMRALAPASAAPTARVGDVRVAPEGSPQSSPPIGSTRERTVSLADSIRAALSGFQPQAQPAPRPMSLDELGKDYETRQRVGAPAGVPGQAGLERQIVEDSSALRVDPKPEMRGPQVVENTAPMRTPQEAGIMQAVQNALVDVGEKQQIPELVQYARERAVTPMSALVEQALARRGGR